MKVEGFDDAVGDLVRAERMLIGAVFDDFLNFFCRGEYFCRRVLVYEGLESLSGGDFRRNKGVEAKVIGLGLR